MVVVTKAAGVHSMNLHGLRDQLTALLEDWPELGQLELRDVTGDKYPDRCIVMVYPCHVDSASNNVRTWEFGEPLPEGTTPFVAIEVDITDP